MNRPRNLTATIDGENQQQKITAKIDRENDHKILLPSKKQRGLFVHIFLSSPIRIMKLGLFATLYIYVSNNVQLFLIFFSFETFLMFFLCISVLW
jgi:hypothetical protein